MFLLCLLNKYDAIYARELEANPGPRFCSKAFRIPLYIEINDLIIPVLTEDGIRPSLVQKIRKHQESDFKQSAGLIIPSVPMCKWIIDQYGLPQTKIHMIINGTDLTEAKKASSLQAKSKLGLSPLSFCLGFVGNIYERYDFNTILQAMVKCQDQIADLYFVIVGEGPLTSEVKAKIDKLGLDDRTIFTGSIQADKLNEILPAFDIGLLCLTRKNSLRYGPITTKLSTYAVYDLAVISAGLSLEGYPDELVQGINLVPPEDPYALADKIIELYNDPKERRQKAKILHNFAREKLTWNAVTEETLCLIRNDTNLQ
jgi:glycosyltransferase involved in cell wall biosynthesis